MKLVLPVSSCSVVEKIKMMHRILERKLKERVEAQSYLVLYLTSPISFVNELKCFFSEYL